MEGFGAGRVPSADSTNPHHGPPSVATTLLKQLAPIVCCAALVSACGGHASIDPGATANYVEDFVYQHTGFRATDVRCPSGIDATAGGRFNCHFTGPEGPYTAYMRILNVKGRRVLFESRHSRRTGLHPRTRRLSLTPAGRQARLCGRPDDRVRCGAVPRSEESGPTPPKNAPTSNFHFFK